MFRIVQLPNLRWIPKPLFPPIPERPPSTQLPVAKDTTQEKENVQMTSAEGIRDAIAELLNGCNIRYGRTPYDQDLHDLCIKECNLKGYPVDSKIHGRASILKQLRLGVIITSNAYSHLTRELQVYVALYGGFTIWIDDTFEQDAMGVDSFVERFITGRKQANAGLDGFDRFLREARDYFPGHQADVVITTSLYYVSSIILEFETRGMQVSPHAINYPSYLRTMSGDCDGYGMLIFPPEIPVKSYAAVMPDMGVVINHLNDVLSFYKEELDGDNGNYISVEAKHSGQDKMPVFKQLARDLAVCIARIEKILEGNRPAMDAAMSFINGYTSYHFCVDKRYHLDDMFP